MNPFSLLKCVPQDHGDAGAGSVRFHRMGWLGLGLLAAAIVAVPGTPAVAAETSAKVSAKKPSPVLDDQLRRLLTESLDGYRVGGFLIKPEVSATGLYDSNIYATRTNERSDFVNVYEGSISAQSNWKKNSLGLDAGGSLGRYRTYTKENYNDYWANLNGRLGLTDNLNVFGGIGRSFQHEERGSPEEQLVGSIPTTYRSTNGHAGVAYREGRFSLRAGGTIERLNYDNALPVTNKDRNRDLLGFGAKFGYAVTPRVGVYVQGIRDVRRYVQKLDDFGYARDSHGYRADIGLAARLSNRLHGEAYVGQLSQRFTDTRFKRVSALDFGGHLVYRAAPQTVWTASLDRSLEDTTLPGSSSYLMTTLSGEVKHLVSPRVRLHAAVSASRAEFQDTARKDDYYSALAGMRYYFSPNVYLGGEYRVLIRDSNLQATVNNPASIQYTDDYSRNQAFVTLGAALYPVKNTSYFDAASGELISGVHSLMSGFYVGAQVDSDSLSLDTSGLRGPGADYGTYSRTGFSGGLFGGYGHNFDPLYIGLELEGDNSNADIFHRNDKVDSRTISVSRGRSYGASARLGYTLPTGALLYGRIGAVRTRFDTYYTVNNALQNAYRNGRDVTGLRYGVGMDVPLSGSAFARLDYTYTQYNKIIADVVTEAEQIKPSEDMFRLGLGWQFGGGYHRQQPTVPITNKVGGFYAGARIGRTNLQSKMNGVLNTSPGIISNFVDFAGGTHGETGGLFAGYGFTLSHLYLGIEGSFDDSTARWDHVRTPTGRNFSVARKDSLGLGLRAGYALDDGTLLYLSYGGVRTRFNTTWIKGGNTTAFVDRDDRIYGRRYGLGADVPMTASSFVRLAYAYTDYGHYSFVTSQANPDSMQFANRESTYSLGLGLRM